VVCRPSIVFHNRIRFPSISLPTLSTTYIDQKQEQNLGLHGLNSILLQPRSRFNSAILRSFDLLACSEFLLAGVIHEDPGNLDDADEAEEEVYGCKHDVSRLDDQAPASPDQTRGCKSDVLCKGKLFGRAVEVGDACEDEAPLHDWSPEMYSLDPNRTIPQSLCPALSTRRRSSALPSPALESTPRRPECLRLCLRSEELRPERWPGGAEERAWCGHGESGAPLLAEHSSKHWQSIENQPRSKKSGVE